MIFYLAFIVEIVVLYFVSSRLSRTITELLWRFTRRRSILIGIYAALFFPGTFVHEMSHLLMAIILRIPTGEISLFPDLNGSGGDVRMGSVAIAEVDPFRRSLVGVAPIFLGTALLIGILYVVFRPGAELVWWQLVLAFYFIFTISNTMFSSKKDLEGTAAVGGAIIIVALLVFAVLYFIGVRISFDFSNTFLSDSWVSALQKVDIFLLIPISLNAIIAFLIRLVQKPLSTTRKIYWQ